MTINPKPNNIAGFSRSISQTRYTDYVPKQKPSFTPNTTNTCPIDTKNITPWMLDINPIQLPHEDSYISKIMTPHAYYPEAAPTHYEQEPKELQSNENGWTSEHITLPNTTPETETTHHDQSYTTYISNRILEAVATLIYTICLIDSLGILLEQVLTPLIDRLNREPQIEPISQRNITGSDLQNEHTQQLEHILKSNPEFAYFPLTNGLFVDQAGNLFTQNEQDTRFETVECMITYVPLTVSNTIVLHTPHHDKTKLHLVHSEITYILHTCPYCRLSISNDTMETFLNYYFSNQNKQTL